jgi:hypothetical protein
MIFNKILRAKKLHSEVARAFSSSQQAVRVDFKLIENDDKALFEKFEEAYNDDGLGIMIVDNIPNYKEKREALLPLSQRLANLPTDVLTTLECPEYFYGIGWSHGKEKFMGMPDMLKGSYYANPCYDGFESSMYDDKGMRKSFKNPWPKQGLPELEHAF